MRGTLHSIHHNTIPQVVLEMHLAQRLLDLDQLIPILLNLALNADTIDGLLSSLGRRSDGLGSRNNLGALGMRGYVLLFVDRQLFVQYVAFARGGHETEERGRGVEGAGTEFWMSLESDKVRVVWGASAQGPTIRI